MGKWVAASPALRRWLGWLGWLAFSLDGAAGLGASAATF